VREEASAAGYTIAFGGEGRILPGTDPFQIPRLEVTADIATDLTNRLPAPDPAPLVSRLRYHWRRAIRDRRTYMSF
jgi:hypothetical protein